MAMIGWRGRGGAVRIVPLGDGALLAEFSATLDVAVNARIQAVAAKLREAAPDWVVDVVPSVGALAVHFDVARIVRADPGSADRRLAGARDELRKLIEACVAQAARPEEDEAAPIVVPVCYGGAYGEDLGAVAAQTGLSPDEVVRRHCASPHRVLMVGFAPGHPYIGGLDPKLSVPRRSTPRVRVPEGSIAIANGQSVVYPFSISGGWSIIGRTPLRVFDAHASPPALFSPGRRVRFSSIDAAEFERLRGRREAGS